ELVDWIGNQTGDWFAWAALHQPHIPNEPSDESAERYRVRSVAYAAADLTGKPAFAQAFAVPTDEQIALMQQASRTRAQAALDADRLIQAAVAALALSVDTIIISSDNGASFLVFNQPAFTKTT